MSDIEFFYADRTGTTIAANIYPVRDKERVRGRSKRKTGQCV
jgi:hypothetical protein